MGRGKRAAGIAVGIGLAVTAAPAVASAANDGDGEGEGGAKNIILFIGDGMGVTHIDAARQRYHGAAGHLALETLDELGKVTTYAVEQDSDKPELVTDSASAATAWASGVKTYNNAIGKDAFGSVVPTLMEEAKAVGMRTGNVATSEITDATPAGMFAHVSRRACQGPDFSESVCQESGHDRDDPIAEQIARGGVADVILGGGLSRFEPDDQALMAQNGYTVLGSFGDPALETQAAASQRVATDADLAAVGGPDQRVIGLFNRGNMTVETAKAAAPAGGAVKAEPSLSEMTTKAIDLLSDSGEGEERGFLLQVEGALIDKRAHANDAAQVLGEMKAFDDAVRAAMDWAADRDDTLILVTADHETAGCGIVAPGSFTNPEATAPPVNVDSSNPANNSTPSRLAEANTKDPLRSPGPINGPGSADAKNFAPATFRTPDDEAGVVDGSPEASLWLAFLSGNHTGEDVNIYAGGPGAGAFAGRQDNTDLYSSMKQALVALRQG